MSFSDQAASAVDRPITRAFSITPNDNANLATPTRAIYVGTSGDLKVTTIDGDIISFTALAAGVVHPIRVVKVFATGQPSTIAAGIVGLY